MRSSVLERAGTGDHFGLVILMREGLAAWMAHASTTSTRPANALVHDNDRSSVAVILADALREDMVLALVSMVMTNYQEKCA